MIEANVVVGYGDTPADQDTVDHIAIAVLRHLLVGRAPASPWAPSDQTLELNVSSVLDLVAQSE